MTCAGVNPRAAVNQRVIRQIRNLFNESLVILRQRRHDNFRPFFANFLRDLRQTFIERLVVYDFSLGFFFRSSNHIKQPLNAHFSPVSGYTKQCGFGPTFNLLSNRVNRSKKTTPLTRMARRTRRLDQHQQRIRITIHADLDHLLHIPDVAPLCQIS
jgi:hypothetical protein